jgi:hypothetical protein
MRIGEFAERVAHYCDEKQVEDEDYFLTVLSGVLREIAERFPEVASVTVPLNENCQTLVKMREAVLDFASFSFPPARVSGVYLPDGAFILDARLGEILFRCGGDHVEIFYNRAMPLLDHDSLEEDIEIPLEDEKVELAILLAAYRLLIIDEDGKANAIKVLYDEAAYRLENRSNGVFVGYRSVDGWV